MSLHCTHSHTHSHTFVFCKGSQAGSCTSFTATTPTLHACSPCRLTWSFVPRPWPQAAEDHARTVATRDELAIVNRKYQDLKMKYAEKSDKLNKVSRGPGAARRPTCHPAACRLLRSLNAVLWPSHRHICSGWSVNCKNIAGRGRCRVQALNLSTIRPVLPCIPPTYCIAPQALAEVERQKGEVEAYKADVERQKTENGELMTMCTSLLEQVEAANAK